MKRLILVSVVLTFIAAACVAEEAAIRAKAPKFSLVNAVDGKTYSLDPGDGKLHVVVFTCNQCPYAKAFEQRIIDLGRQYGAKGVTFYAIDPNDDTRFSEETMENMKARAVAKNYP